MARISEKQKQFVDALLADPEMHQTRAYMQVYTSVKNEATAAVNATRLLKKPHVQEYLRQRMKAREKRIEISQDKVINEIARMAFSDIINYAEVDGHRVKIKSTRDIPADMRAAIIAIKEGANGIEVKIADKLKALELLGRHLGMFNDKLDITTDIVLDFGGDPDGD
ncbi:MAG: terminase small subunit [Firmicutes bacterium]|nr:terminase small subunit [Bacillota bacterium]